jgi:hypothetical protein
MCSRIIFKKRVGISRAGGSPVKAPSFVTVTAPSSRACTVPPSPCTLCLEHGEHNERAITDGGGKVETADLRNLNVKLLGVLSWSMKVRVHSISGYSRPEELSI